MKFRYWLAAVAAAAGIAAGTTAVPAAQAATPSCGPACIDIFSWQFGTFFHPGFLLDSFRQGSVTGTPLILFQQADNDPAEDFTLASEGQVSALYAQGLVQPALALNYGCGWSLSESVCTSTRPDDYAVEIEYAPYGADTGECVGVASVAVAGEKVTLQPCGVSSKTVWVADTVDSCPRNPLYFAEVPLINGSDTNFSHPLVLRYPGGANPVDKPRPRIDVTNLTGFSQSGGSGPCGTGSIAGPASNLLWSAKLGVVH